MAGNETTFTKLIAIKDGGGNPSAPGSADLLDLTFGSVNFNSSLRVSNVGTAGGLFVGWDGTNAFGVHNDTAFLGASGNPDSYSFSLDAVLTASGDALFSATGGDANDPDFQVDGYAKFAGIVELADDLEVGGDLSVAGISTLTGAVQAQDTLSVTNGVTVGDTLGVSGAVDFDLTLNVTGNATFGASATVNGNLTVLGTLVTKQTESVLISDNYIDMSSDYTTVSPQDTGLTFNYSPIANASITAMDSVANTITVSGAISLNPGDIVLVTGLDAADVENEGLYEVLTFASNVITVNVASGLTFLKHAVATTLTGLSATLAHVNLGVLRVSIDGNLQYGENSNANITFGDVPYDGYSGAQSWTSELFLTAPANAQGSFFTVSDSNSDQVFGVGAGLATVNGDLRISNNGEPSSYALDLQQVADGHPTVAADFGKVYSKSEMTGNDAIPELFYTSEIGGVDTPVQITKNGALNIDVLNFSLQEAYNDGNTIVTDAQGAVSITANSGDALVVSGPADFTGAFDVTGNVNIVGDLDASGFADFAHTGGNVNAPDFNVAGYAKIAQGLYVDSTLDVTGAANLTSSLSVSDAATLSSTLDVTGAVLLLSTLNVTDAATLNGAVTVDNTLAVTGAATFSSTITGSGDLALKDGQAVDKFTVNAATGNTNIEGTLDVTSSATFDSNVSVLGGLGVTGAATFADTLGVTGAATLSSTLDVTGAATFLNSVTSNGTLTAENNLVVNGDYIRIAEAAEFSLPAADTGSVYVSEDPAAAGHAELWYYGDGTENPVMITKNGQLNIDVLTFSLQAAYDDGSAIVTNAQNGAVSITAGANLTDALDVTGNVDVQGNFASSGTSTFTSVTGSQQNPDFAVSGISQFSGDVYMGSSLVVGPTWPNQAGESLTVNGSATIYDTLTVNSSTTLYGNLATVSNAVNTFSVDVASGNTDIKGTLTVAGDISLTNAQAVEVFSVSAATGNVWAAGSLDADGAATVGSTLTVTGDITGSGDLSILDANDAPVFSVDAATGDTTVAGILDLNGSLDADVTGFDVLSSGGLSLESASLLSITASASDVVVSASGTIKLKGSYVASNINANATAAQIGLNKAVSMTSAGLVAAQANAKDVIVLGVSVETIASSATAFGKIAEFGVAQAAVEASISIVAGDKLYLSAATAGAVTNVAPTASDTTVFLMGVALTADASGLVTMALRQQFLYSNY